MKQEANALREENKSLLTAIRLMNNELQNSNEEECVPISSTNLHEQISERVKGVAPIDEKESPWVSVNNVKSKQRKKRSKKAKLSTNATIAEPHRPTTDRNQSSHENRRSAYAATEIQNPSISVCCENPSTYHMAKKKLVFIAGDSIIQHVQGWDLSRNDKHVAVKSFSGAHIADMEDYLKPLLRKEPDKINLHVGTNNIRDESPRSVAEGIVNLVTQIQQDFPTSTHLTISPLLPMSDNLEFNDKIKEANEILKSFCSSGGFKLLRIKNIDLTCVIVGVFTLTAKGLHFFQIPMRIILTLIDY